LRKKRGKRPPGKKAKKPEKLALALAAFSFPQALGKRGTSCCKLSWNAGAQAFARIGKPLPE
jgi:hypothetical protein